MPEKKISIDDLQDALELARSQAEKPADVEAHGIDDEQALNVGCVVIEI